MNYYNEYDKHAAAWLRELIAAGLIPPGDVDTRSIVDVQPADLRGYLQCHFFAGIGGWSEALRLAEWPADREVWTGSCPCQPYSVAGKQQGNADARDLWPQFARLIRECKPPTVFGEQVEGAVRHGWLDRVCGNLEAEGYACGSAVLGAHSVGAPHIRQRLYWLADSSRTGLEERSEQPAREELQAAQRSGAAGGLADAAGGQREQRLRAQGDGLQRSTNNGADGGVVQSNSAGPQPGIATTSTARHGSAIEPAGFWDDYDLIQCRDGKARRVESGVFPLAHGVPGRVGLLRGYGNAIVPQVASEFVRAFL